MSAIYDDGGFNECKIMIKNYNDIAILIKDNDDDAMMTI